MLKTRLVWMVLLLCNLCLGCTTTPGPPLQTARLTFAADRYPAVFEAVIETLRDQGYRVDRRDYRLGTITTFPKEAATAAEYWIDDATVRSQQRSDTLNAQQRTATATITRNDEAPFDYQLEIEVFVERLQRPSRYLTHSASARISARYSEVPAHLKDQGIDGPYAIGIERDPLLERRLIEAIKASAD